MNLSTTLGDHFRRQMRERNDRIEAVAELRREQAVDRFHVVALALRTREAEGRARHVGGAGIRRHDQDDVAEIDLLAVVIGQLPVIHDLQQDVVEIGMRLLDLVEQAARNADAGRPRR